MATMHRGALAWSRLIEEWRGSGLSLPEFCRRRGIKKTTMSGWVYKPDLKHAIETARLREDQADRGVPAAVVKSFAANSTPAFVPVRLRQLVTPPEIAAATRSAIEIIVGSGRRVVVQEGFDAETLRQVVAALEVVSW